MEILNKPGKLDLMVCHSVLPSGFKSIEVALEDRLGIGFICGNSTNQTDEGTFINRLSSNVSEKYQLEVIFFPFISITRISISGWKQSIVTQ